MTTVDLLAPAKVNLCLHVTGQRSDGYHLLDSIVMFADLGDRIALAPAPAMALTVTGPRAAGVPDDARNLCWKAADRYGRAVSITLDKHLPAAAGIGGGSSDAAAVLRGLERMTGRPPAFDPLALGADVPVCMLGRAARMTGIGEGVEPLDLPPLPAVLVNPGIEVPTPSVFRALPSKHNPPLDPIPEGAAPGVLIDWLATQRNDLEPPARAQAPVIGAVLAALAPARLARMSGSGATCFGLCDSLTDAQALADAIQAAHPGWWVAAVTLS
ncbi:4-(cytidine 5'-diphospho)-2-C-methyl-D-erythritol kinase [Thetidibacter halocola]|uniref:4-diphosphocytidyl-2-C-methyl-D-erythritol kinase n=1 Tax=Thetidibacter halocola TaxID=2827239 RepID=A0A8J8BBL9_9RHOB|nr:4-(cytidine 5'-diphospho)-2-C-methyl-D-erythritol kinase [Thetidibacter halocola]MBS0126363.1 4-(cytidine 5'-diphospho)-2-C-methyl-D-erythritol kinase [Thetidibacter halocola]